MKKEVKFELKRRDYPFSWPDFVFKVLMVAELTYEVHVHQASWWACFLVVYAAIIIGVFRFDIYVEK